MMPSAGRDLAILQRGTGKSPRSTLVDLIPATAIRISRARSPGRPCLLKWRNHAGSPSIRVSVLQLFRQLRMV